ncbi:MAG: amidohydrolase family protein [Gammaproteobacteria bacterium]|jgi:predicted TIM-barrel fold metal-dependent hydrolase
MKIRHLKNTFYSISLALVILSTGLQANDEFRFNDGHIHYNKDVWSRLPPERALNYLSESGIDRFILFSTPTEGTEKLYELAPDRVIPFIMPYKNHLSRYLFHSDPKIVDYLREKIETGNYRGIGEFHLFRKHKDTEVVKQIMQLAADYNLAINAHSDFDTIKTLIALQPDLQIIWAHCGMNHPLRDIEQAFEEFPNLYCDLSFRYKMFDEDEQWRLRPEWKAVLEKHADRFVLGMDTYIPRRWAALPEHAEFADDWLKQLSEEAQNKIARENINNWFP